MPHLRAPQLLEKVLLFYFHHAVASCGPGYRFNQRLCGADVSFRIRSDDANRAESLGGIVEAEHADLQRGVWFEFRSAGGGFSLGSEGAAPFLHGPTRGATQQQVLAFFMALPNPPPPTFPLHPECRLDVTWTISYRMLNITIPLVPSQANQITLFTSAASQHAVRSGSPPARC